MKKIFYLIVIMLLALSSYSQTIVVVDKTTQQYIEGAAVYTKDAKTSIQTDAKGRADASIFKTEDSIFFRYVGYKTAAYTYRELEAKKFIVELSDIKITLDEVIISANRWEESRVENPYRIEKISMKDVKFLNPQTAADMLATNGHVYMQKSQLAGGSPTLRGFATNRVLLVVDGVRMNNAIYRTGNIQNVISLDAGSMESSEILFGPGAVMYGSDAIGGVMDFHSLKPEFSEGKKPLIKGNAFGRYSSANSEKTGNLNLNIGLKKLAFLSSFSYSDYDDLLCGSNGNSYFLRPTYQKTIDGIDSTLINSDKQLQKNSGYSQTNFMQKISFKPNLSMDIDYGFYYSETSDAPRYDRLCLDAKNDGKLDYAEWYYGPQKWIMNRLGITFSEPNKFFDRMRFVAALQNYEESRNDRKTGKSKLRTQTENVDAWSFNLDIDKDLTGKATLFYGAEAIYNNIGSVARNTNIFTGKEEPTTTRYPDGSSWQEYGVYANIKYKLKPEWIFNAGVRYSQYIVKADFNTTMFPFPFVHAENNNGALNGSIGITWHPDKTWQLYLNGSTGFRAPNIDDIGKVFSSEPGAVVVPNADLKPEYAYNAEAGTYKTFNDFFKIDLSVYYTILDNALARRDYLFKSQDSIMYDGELSRVQAIQNITRAYVYGIQAGVLLNFGSGFSFSGAFNFQKGEEQSEDSLIYYPISHIMPIFGNAHLSYEMKKLKLDFYALFNGKMKYDDLPLTDRNDAVTFAKDADGLPYVPGWYTLNFMAAWYINKNFTLNLGVENITDQLYRPYSSGISAPGRNLIAALRCNF